MSLVVVGKSVCVGGGGGGGPGCGGTLSMSSPL